MCSCSHYVLTRALTTVHFLDDPALMHDVSAGCGALYNLPRCVYLTCHPEVSSIMTVAMLLLAAAECISLHLVHQLAAQRLQQICNSSN